jgi:hypothetical protein
MGMLQGMNPISEALGRVPCVDIAAVLGQNRAGIVFAVHQMNRDARIPLAGIQDRPVNMHSIHAFSSKIGE